MLFFIPPEIETPLIEIAKKINMTCEFTAKMLFKASLKIELNGIEKGLLDVNNDQVIQDGNLIKSRQYTHDLEKHQNNSDTMTELNAIIDRLKNHRPIPEQYHDHRINGEFGALRELHLKDRHLVLYYNRLNSGEITLITFGEFSKIFIG